MSISGPETAQQYIIAKFILYKVYKKALSLLSSKYRDKYILVYARRYGNIGISQRYPQQIAAQHPVKKASKTLHFDTIMIPPCVTYLPTEWTP